MADYKAQIFLTQDYKAQFFNFFGELKIGPPRHHILFGTHPVGGSLSNTLALALNCSIVTYASTIL